VLRRSRTDTRAEREDVLLQRRQLRHP
jgi:hypothetical protein